MDDEEEVVWHFLKARVLSFATTLAIRERDSEGWYGVVQVLVDLFVCLFVRIFT